MTELSEHDHAVAARWNEILATDTIEHRVEIINLRARPLKAAQHRHLNALFASPRSVQAKIEGLWLAVDEVTAIAKPHAACRRGCSHCCHIEVHMPEQEAALIGKRIGVKPKQVIGNTMRGDIKGGYDNPCPFLEHDQCSIYEHRPLACRQHVNMDRDALLCELTGEPNKVPYLNLFDYTTALAMVTAEDGRRPKVGDIRQFFPRGKR
ncbi:Fe-S-cluster containining protein [Paraburkholderia sp. BL8N3]|nr:YkgJ family cysteine cluster protein [Paraburkholderia sp. BL8N3]TCK37944.1 Fe-S-cluster containining protein [Paraburkholderia sp. BL8N3]